MAFNPSKHIPLSKSLATINFPIVAQSYYYDEALFVYRPYISEVEVTDYIGVEFRKGSYDIVINFGGTLVSGVVTGGENKLYWFDNDGTLKPKGGSGSTNIGSFDYPAEGDFGSQVITLTDEQRELVGNYPDVKVFDVSGLIETQMPDPNPVFERNSDGDLLTITIDAASPQVIRVTGANAGVAPGGDGTGDLTNANFVDGEEPAGDIDGTNVTYTLAFTPVAGSVKLYLNGARQRAGAGNDYTIAGDTITMEDPLEIGDVLLADYRK